MENKKTSDLGHLMIPTSFGIVQPSVNQPTILSVCKNCSAKCLHIKNKGTWYEIKNKIYEISDFLNITCNEFIIKGLLE